MRSALMVALFLVTCLVHAETFIGKVIKVVDGDTICVMDSQDHQEKIRVMEIDAPERRQAFGRVASAEMARLVAGTQVTALGEKRDRDHLIVGKVMVSTECEMCPMDNRSVLSC